MCAAHEFSDTSQKSTRDSRIIAPKLREGAHQKARDVNKYDREGVRKTGEERKNKMSNSCSITQRGTLKTEEIRGKRNVEPTGRKSNR